MQHSCSHYNAFRNIPWQTRTYLRTWQHQMTTMKQPFQCNLQPEIQEPHGTTHTDTTTRCKTHRRNKSRTKRPQPHPPHTRYLSSPVAATLHGKTQGFVLRLPPQNKAHATFMQPFQCDLQPQLQEKPLYTEKHKVSCSGFLPNSPLPFLTASHRHHFPSSPPPFVHFSSSPLPFVTTSHRHHFPSSPLPFVTTRHYHHPSSKSIPLLLILLLCIVMLCIVM